MKFYVAAPFPMRHVLRRFRDELVNLGHIVTATWVDVEPDDEDHTWEEREVAARQCLVEVAAADVLMLITADPHSGSGGRHVECGYALALGLPVWRLGPRTHVFTALAEREFADTADCLAAIRAERTQESSSPQVPSPPAETAPTTAGKA
jgi:nucleoside 2-deoxyribosyltransferase